MVILILANSDGGLYRFRKELIETLCLEHDVHISCPFGTFVDELLNIGCHLYDSPLAPHGTNPYAEYKLYLYYKKLLTLTKPDMVFTYTIKPNVYGGLACANDKIPYVANITGLGLALTCGGVLQQITTALYKAGLKDAQKVFFQNVQDLEFMLQKGIVKTHYDLLPGSGVNLDQFRVLDYPKGVKTNFLFLSRVMKQKGIEQYIEAAQYIHNKYTNTVFHICGTCDDAYKKKIEELSNQGIIVYHGFVKNLLDFQKISACTIHPTYYPEGMSNVLLESAACGRPIITTNRSGCREVVDDGVNGFIVKQKDSHDLIEKIEKFLSLSFEERKIMGLNGRLKVEREFNRQIVINKYLEEISKVNRDGL